MTLTVIWRHHVAKDDITTTMVRVFWDQRPAKTSAGAAAQGRFKDYFIVDNLFLQ